MAAETVPAAGRPKHKLRWYQYSLRTLLLVMTLACVGMSWVAVKMKQARQQHAAVEAIRKLGGMVDYDYQKKDPFDEPPGPAWLRKLLGDDLFASVTWVRLSDSDVSDAALEYLKGLARLEILDLNRTNVSDAGLQHLKGLTQLRELCLGGTKVSDAGLENLMGLTQLQKLWLDSTNVTDAGAQDLQKALPNLEIIR
ncbi:MAG: hypothetical protein ACLQLG_01800 [Thermoguttaceae bacterium]